MEVGGELCVDTANYGAGGEVLGDFFGVIWARDDCDGVMREVFKDDVAHAFAGASFDAFGA